MGIIQPVQHAKTALEVSHQIEALVLEGVLRVGDRLPGEREISLETGVSRPVVREAIKALEGSGILVSRHGEGTFVADVIGTVFTPQVSQLLASHAKATLDFLEYRREVEAIAARMAATRATAADRQLLDRLMARMEAAYGADDFDAETSIDVEFHSLIGEMAHNLVLLHTLRSCYRLLSVGVFQNRARLYQTPGGRRALFEQHRAIHAAIAAGDGEEAASAARAHIEHVIAATREMEALQERERVSTLRLAQRDDEDARRPKQRRHGRNQEDGITPK